MCVSFILNQQAEEDAAKKARILARLESENNAKSAKMLSSVSSRQTTTQKSGKPQTASHSSKNKHPSESTVGEMAKKVSQNPQTSLKTKAKKHRESVPKQSEDSRTDSRKKDKEITTSKSKKQPLVNKTPKSAPVNFKDLLKIAEEKAKDPNTKIEAEEYSKSSFQIKQKQYRKGNKPFTTSKTETTNTSEITKKKRKTEQSRSRKVPHTETKTQPPQNVKSFESSRISKTTKCNDFVSGSKNGGTKNSVQISRPPKGASIEAQLGFLPAANSNTPKAPRESKINDGSLHIHEKRIENRNFARSGEQRASGIEAQLGPVKKTSHERKRKYKSNDYIRNEKSFDRKPVRRDLPRASGIEAQMGSSKRSKQEDVYRYDKIDEYDEMDGYRDEFDDFIDDSGDEVDVSSHIRDIFGYDRTRYQNCSYVLSTSSSFS